MKARVSMAVLSIVLLLCSPKMLIAQTFELAYDDGTYDYAWSDTLFYRSSVA